MTTQAKQIESIFVVKDLSYLAASYLGPAIYTYLISLMRPFWGDKMVTQYLIQLFNLQTP